VKSKRTIQQQLMLNILIPVLLIFSAVFFFTYKNAYDQLESNSADDRRHILEETENLTRYYDHSMRNHELVFVDEMKEMAFNIQSELKNQNANGINLFQLSSKLGIDTSYQHIYIINRKCVIVNTTFAPDKGLDFTKLNLSYDGFFKKIFEEDAFKEDRFGLEMKTGKIKKYAFLPTSDKQYIIELGFYSKEADGYKALLLNTIKNMSKRFKSIEGAELYLGIKGIPDVSMTNKRIISSYLKCLETGKNQRLEIYNSKKKHKEAIEFCFIPVQDSRLYTGYVLAIKSNNKAEKELLYQLLLYFILSFAGALAVLVALIYTRAKRITKPIEQFSKETEAITTENLNHQFDIKGSKELEQLSTSFSEMMTNLRVSYEGLEEKVRERTSELVEQKAIVEHKNNEIIDSISYARFIQHALLPSEKIIQQQFPESFVYFEPKDIIAGDFYWFENKNDISWFAVADCTGHGVPGAMVSVLCINSLNQALIEYPGSTTGELLNLVRDKVVATFTKEEGSVKDGMDISIANFNHNTKVLQWSGANNPLWIYRDEEVLTFAPNKQPIGQFEAAVPFETHEIHLKKNDLIILFSDGFADQFGGPKGKKYKYAPFREFISENKSSGISVLKEKLKTEFHAWKGEIEQTDDVCVMGIKIN